MRLDKNNIKRGGTISYDADLDSILIRHWAYDGLQGPYLYEEALRVTINALRRSLAQMQKGRRLAQRDAFINTIKPEGAYQ